VKSPRFTSPRWAALKPAARRPALVGVILTSTLLLSACASGAPASEGADATFADSITVGSSLSLPSLNPFESQYSTQQFASYDALVRLTDGSAEPEARLATSWENTDDLTWVFTLREGVTFHDGSAFTAEDVVFTLNETLAQKYIGSSLLTNFESFTATDDYTFTLVTKTPDPLVLTKLSQVYVVPSDAWVALGADAFAGASIGTGPYEVTDFVADSGMTLEAYDGFWGDAPATPTVNYRTFADQTALASALEAGEIDVAHQLANSAIDTLASNTDLELFGEFSGNQNYFQINTTQAPFDNVEVREAANLAIDADALVAALTAGAGEIEDGQLPMSGIFGHSDEITRPDFDLEEAKQLLEDNDAVGAEITINGLAAYKTLYEAIGAQLEEAGFVVTIEPVDISVWLQEFKNGTDADIFYRGMSYVGTKDADRPFSFVSATAQPMVVDPEWDALYAATKTELDPATREELIVEASQYLNDQSYILWTYGSPSVGATTTAVDGADFSTGLALILDTITKSE
jgi:peptide/nickel transport system substrate-binding protein